MRKRRREGIASVATSTTSLVVLLLLPLATQAFLPNHYHHSHCVTTPIAPSIHYHGSWAWLKVSKTLVFCIIIVWCFVGELQSGLRSPKQSIGHCE